MLIKYINLLTASTCIAPFRSLSLAHYQIVTNQIIGNYGGVLSPLEDRETVLFGTLPICLLLMESSWTLSALDDSCLSKFHNA